MLRLPEQTPLSRSCGRHIRLNRSALRARDEAKALPPLEGALASQTLSEKAGEGRAAVETRFRRAGEGGFSHVAGACRRTTERTSGMVALRAKAIILCC